MEAEAALSTPLRTRIEIALLKPFCRKPGSAPLTHDRHEHEPLQTLQEEYPNLADLLAGKRVLDFGCGLGRQSIALAETFGCEVFGLDTNLRTLAAAQSVATTGRVTFGSIAPDSSFDVIVSQNAFEHFDDPKGVIETMKRLLAPGGVILLTFGPPWLAPFGAHMHHFCRLPWVNLLFSEQAVMTVRADFSKDGAMRYEDARSGLNKMTIARFDRLMRASGLIGEINYRGVKGIDWLCKLPVIRELATNHVTSTLRKR